MEWEKILTYYLSNKGLIYGTPTTQFKKPD
jgi:hypothetical protein